MNRKLKALGLAMFAAFAFSAIGATAAQATEDPEFTGAPTAFATAEGNELQVFDAFGSEVDCDHAEFAIERLADPSTATVEPTYKECSAFGSLPATVEMTSCDFVFTVDHTDPGEHEYTGTASVECEDTGDEIHIWVFASQAAHEGDPGDGSGAICRVTIPEQSGLERITYTNNNGHIDVDGPVTGITATQERESIFCPSGTHEEDGEYTINEDVTVEGENHLGEDEAIEIG